jgi:hypothetical protein
VTHRWSARVGGRQAGALLWPSCAHRTSELLAAEVRNEIKRRQILPLEQQPRIVEAAAQLFQGSNLSLYGDQAELVGQLAPLFEILGRAVREGTAAGTGTGGHQPQ